MRQSKLLFLLVVLMSMTSNKSYAYDIAVKNVDDITIYYRWINEKSELAVDKKEYEHYSGNVIIPESVDYNGKYYSVTAIGMSAFSQCENLSSVIIPNSVTSIDYLAFSYCTQLTSIDIPNSVISIAQMAFLGCSSLESINIPNSVISIGYGAFDGCNSLTAVNISDLSSWIGINFNYYCDDPGPGYEKHYYYANPLRYAHHLYLNGEEVTNLVIPDGVTSINKYAFDGCTGLTTVTIPNNIISIEDYAFPNCGDLNSVIIGSGVTSIGYRAFSGTNIKKTIWLTNTPPSGYEYSGANGTINYVSNEHYNFLENKVCYHFLSSYFFVDGIMYVPISPSDRTCDAIDCRYNESVENVNIGQTISNKGITLIVKNVNPYTCYGNYHIKDVKLSFGGDIGDYAFYGCSGLNTATVSNKGSIGTSAFQSCKSLTTATINNQGNIGASAFQTCSAMTTATINNQGGIGQNAFSECPLLETAELGQNVTSIDGYAFSGCSKLKSIVIPDAVITLGSYAFTNCADMTSVKTGNGIETIDECTFLGCSSLNEINIGSKVKTINKYAFSGCSALPSITIPQAVTTIGNNVFYNCTSLAKVTIADSETTLTFGYNNISYYDSNPIFSSCPLNYVYIGRDITYQTSSSYGYSPFYRNTTLKEVKITDKETDISKNEFYGCTNLQTVTIGDGVTTIGSRAFSGCSSLKYFAFGSKVQDIGQEAFSDCTALTEISSKAYTPPVCGSQALDDINKWECKLVVPKDRTLAYQDAEQWRDFFFMEEGEPSYNIISGDANGDGKVDSSDINAIVDYIMIGKTEGFIFNNADTNGDQKVNVADIVQILNIIKAQ